MTARTLLVAVPALVLMAGCKSTSKPEATPAAPQKPAVLPAPPTPIDEKKAELGGTTWQPQWTTMVEQALPPQMLSARAARAVRSYCPRFADETEAEKREFWAYLFQALAGAEAGLNPTSDVHHVYGAENRIDPATHRPTRQEGLLQLTYQDGQRYGCDFDWEHDRALPATDPQRTILEPSRNLGCGIKIMENQIIAQNEPLATRHSYWATLQPGTAGHRVFLKQMVNVPEACRPLVRRRRNRRAEVARGRVAVTAPRSRPSQ